MTSERVRSTNPVTASRDERAGFWGVSSSTISVWVHPPKRRLCRGVLKKAPEQDWNETIGEEPLQIWSRGLWVGSWNGAFTGGEIWRLPSDDISPPPSAVVDVAEPIVRKKLAKDKIRREKLKGKSTNE